MSCVNILFEIIKRPIICDDGTIEIVKALEDCKALYYVRSLTEIVRP